MATTAYLHPLTLPSGTAFPGTMQQLVNLICQYAQILGIADLGGINKGETTPSESDRDKAWFKTDASGNPIGWYSWNGSEWAQILFAAPYGVTADRPGSPVVGQLYLDTDIDALLVYERSAWRTVSGSPGDIKFVNKPTLAEALAANPGWTQYTDASQRVIAAADATTDHDIGDTVGVEETTLTEAELPAHTHPLSPPDGSSADNGDQGPYVVTSEDQSTGAAIFATTTGSTGDGEAFSIMQPTIYAWCLVKS